MSDFRGALKREAKELLHAVDEGAVESLTSAFGDMEGEACELADAIRSLCQLALGADQRIGELQQTINELYTQNVKGEWIAGLPDPERHRRVLVRTNEIHTCLLVWDEGVWEVPGPGGAEYLADTYLPGELEDACRGLVEHRVLEWRPGHGPKATR